LLWQFLSPFLVSLSVAMNGADSATTTHSARQSGPRPSASSQARQSSCQTRTRTPRRRPRQQPPHVTNDHWYGHDRPDDKRYRVDHAFDRGRFEHFGPSYRYRIERFDRDHHRFWFPGGFYFQVADWDWARCCRLVLELRG
jgi:hypothetical protein